MKYSQERKPSAFGEFSRAAELRPKQAVLARLAPPHPRAVNDVAAELVESGSAELVESGSAELVESVGSIPSRSSPGEGLVSPPALRAVAGDWANERPRAAGRRRRHVAWQPPMRGSLRAVIKALCALCG